MSGCREAPWAGGWSQRARVPALEQSTAVTLSRGSTLLLSVAGANGWVCRADIVRKLSVGELGIAIGVDTADDSEELGLAGVVATRAQESTHVEGVDTSIVVAVNAAVGCQRAEIVAHLELTLQDVKAAHEVDLLLEDVEEGTLNVVWQRFVATAETRGTIEGHVS
mgnify:FL=1